MICCIIWFIVNGTTGQEIREECVQVKEAILYENGFYKIVVDKNDLGRYNLADNKLNKLERYIPKDMCYNVREIVKEESK